MAPDSPPIKEDEVLLILNDEFTNLALEATGEAHQACKQALKDVETQDLLLLNDNETGSLNPSDERLLSHTLLKDIKQKTKTDPWAVVLATDSHFQWKEGLLYHEGTRIYIPDNLTMKLHILKAFHDAPTVGHQSHNKTLTHIKLYFYWEGLYSFINKYMQSCEVC